MEPSSEVHMLNLPWIFVVTLLVKVLLVASPATAAEPENEQNQALDPIEAARNAVSDAKRALDTATSNLRQLETADDLDVQAVLGIQSHELAIEALAVSPDDLTLATAGNEFQVRIWETRSGQKTAQFDTVHNRGISSLTFTPDGQFLLVGGVTGNLEFYSTKDYQKVRTLQVGAEFVEELKFNQDGSKVLVAGLGPIVELWETQKWVRLDRFDTGMSFIKSIEFRPDEEGAIAAGGYFGNDPSMNGHKVIAWTWKQNEVDYRLGNSPKSFFSWARERNNKSVLVLNQSRQIQLWNPDEVEAQGDFCPGTEVDSVSLTPDGEHLVMVVGRPSELLFLSVANGDQIDRMPIMKNDAGITELALSSDAVYVGTRAGRVERIPLPEKYRSVKPMP